MSAAEKWLEMDALTGGSALHDSRDGLADPEPLCSKGDGSACPVVGEIVSYAKVLARPHPRPLPQERV
jgi:hypothetical protein